MIPKKVTAILSSSLHSNSIYLILAQGVMTGFGYLFWIFIARLYPSSDVGVAGTLISITVLISQISILGLNQALVRYLPTSTQKNSKINTCIAIVTASSLCAAVIYVMGMNFFSPDLIFVRNQPALLGLFLAAMVLTTLNTFTDSIFLARQATKYNVVIYAIYSMTRVILPFVFLPFGAVGIFMAHVAGVLVALLLSFYYMIKKFDYRPAFVFNMSIIKMISGYSFSNYIAGFLWGAPLLIAPLLVLNQLGARSAAYFYMVMMIVNILLIIPTSITQSLFAEGSHKNNEHLRHIVAKSLRFGLVLSALAIAGVFLFGELAISIFGREYASGGSTVMYILAASALLVMGNMTGNVILKLKKRIIALVVINGFGAAITICLFVVLLSQGLVGIGYGFLLGQTAQLFIFGCVFLPILLRHRRELMVESTRE